VTQATPRVRTHVHRALSVRRVGDDRPGSSRQQEATQRIGVVGPVGGEGGGRRRGLDQVGGDGRITSLARRDDEGDKAAEPIDQGVQLGRRSAARATYAVG